MYIEFDVRFDVGLSHSVNLPMHLDRRENWRCQLSEQKEHRWERSKQTSKTPYNGISFTEQRGHAITKKVNFVIRLENDSCIYTTTIQHMFWLCQIQTIFNSTFQCVFKIDYLLLRKIGHISQTLFSS